MAKQFGVGDEALAGLRDPATHPFPENQRAALRFADAVTSGGDVPDSIFLELRRHYDEPQIVEIASVIGLFNYFNRFNNALRVDITLADPEVLGRRIDEAAGEEPGPEAFAHRVAILLAEGRRYDAVRILGGAGAATIPLAVHGDFGPEITGPGERPDVLGVDVLDGAGEVVGRIVVRSGRPEPLGDDDRAALERAAGTLGRSLRP